MTESSAAGRPLEAALGRAVRGRSAVAAVRTWLATRSLRARVALLVAVAVGLAVALVSIAGYLSVRHELQARLDRTLLTRVQSAVDTPLIDPLTLARVPAAAFGSADVRIALVLSDGTAVSAAGEASSPPLGPAELAVARGASALSLRTASLDGVEYRVAAVPAGLGQALVLAQGTAETWHELATLGVVLLVVGLAGVALAGTAGLLVALGRARPGRAADGRRRAGRPHG